MKSPQEILDILKSIADVRLNDGEFEFKHRDTESSLFEIWETNRGYNPNSFSQRLLFLIEEELKGELSE